MTKTFKGYNLDALLVEKLRATSKARGVTMGDLVEQGLRQVLDLPAPPVVAEDEGTGLSATRTEKTMLHELTKAGPGWHHERELSKATGASISVGRKALLALAREGKAFRWGDAYDAHGGALMTFEFGFGAWAIRPAMDVIRELATRAGKLIVLADAERELARTVPGMQHWATLKKAMTLRLLIQKLALGIEDIEAVRAEAQKARLFTSLEDNDLRNYSEVYELERRAAHAARAVLEAEHQDKVSAMHREIDAEQRIARAMDSKE